MGVLYDGATQYHSGQITTIVDNTLLSAWVYPNSNKAQSILQMVAPANNTRYVRVLLNAGGTASAQMSFGVGLRTATSANTVTLGTWNHVLGYFTSGYAGIILNGGTEVTDATAVTYPSTMNTCWIGAKSTVAEFFDGKIADAGLWEVMDGIIIDLGGEGIIANAINGMRQTANWWLPDMFLAYYHMRDENVRSWYSRSTSTFPLTATGGPVATDSPILKPPWRVNSHPALQVRVIRMVGRIRQLGSIQIGGG